MKAQRRLGVVLPALAALAAMIWLAAAGSGHAQQANPVFTVSDIPVDATAASAAAAREAARLDGQRRAFAVLLARLTAAGDRGRLPKVPDAKLTEMVRDFEVAGERSSAVRYLASYTFRFRPDDVRKLLSDAGIPFTETVSKPVTVLPVLHRGDAMALWDDPNPWREAWANRKPDVGLVPIDVPLGEASDVAAIGPEQAVAADPAAIAAITAAHGGGDALIAEARIDQSGQLETKIRRVSGSQPADISAAAYRPNPGESEADLMARAVAASLADLEEAWKRQTLPSGGAVGGDNVLVAELPLSGINDWLFARDRLSGVALVKRSELLAIGRRAARVEIHFSGDPAQLRLALAQRDLVLSGEGNTWTLQRRAAAPPPGQPGTP